MKIEPLADRVLVQPAEQEKVTKTGIIIPDTVVDPPQHGTVIACGPGGSAGPMSLKPGYSILFGKNAGVQIEVDGTSMLMMKEADVMAITNRNDPAVNAEAAN